MAYEPVTPEQFKTAKPQFDAVPDATVQVYLDMAARVVDKSWLPGDYQPAIIAFTCHLMTLEGLGSDPASKMNALAGSGLQSIKSGTLTLTRFKEDAGQTDYESWLKSTACGKYFAMLLQMNRGGPRIVAVGTIRPSPYAKDWPGPAYGWPGVFLGLKD